MSNVKVGGPRVAGVPGAQHVENQGGQQVRGPRAAGGAVQPGLREISKAEIAALGGAQVEQKQVRVRFAPSPTGHLHIGGARTALMNYLFAKKMGGEFVLRIEDTDQMRSRPEYTEAILGGLKWLGMQWDGDPIYQSQRGELYKGKVDQLLKEGKAYKDPAGSGAIFFKMPEEGTITIQDGIKGTVTVNVANSDGNSDYVIMRADGSPTFLLANVIDDGDQGITHILRGDDHLTNAARQTPLFRALGYEVPKFYHMPLIHGDPERDPETGEMKPGGKLSKRHGATSVVDYEQLGYDPKVLSNHVARMGMQYETNQTVGLEDLAKQFDALKMSKSPSTLGLASLDARMMMHIKKAPVGELAAELKSRLGNAQQLEAHLTDPGTEKRPGFFERTAVTAAEAKDALKGVTNTTLEALADGAKARARTFAEMIDMLVFFRAKPVYEPEKKQANAGPEARKLMGKLKTELAKIPEDQWNMKTLDGALERFNGANKVGYQSYGTNLRWMLTGVTDGLPLHNLMGVVGRGETLRRLEEMTAG